MTGNVSDVMTLSGKWKPVLAVWNRNGTMTTKREQCDNCGRFVAWHSLSWDDTINSIVCHSCAPAVELAEYDDDVASLLVDDDPFRWR